MSTQISIQLSDKMFSSAKKYADKHGFDNLQDFIRDLIRQRLFEKEQISGLLTALASEKSLAKDWLTKAEDKAWAHLKKGK